MEIVILFLNILILISIGLISRLWKKTLSSYLSEKGKNLATKEDIEDITRKIEKVKAEIEENKLIFQKKYQLKHEAYLNALSLIDAYFSHVLGEGEEKPTKQYATTEYARATHNKLILSCENKNILKKYEEIMFGQEGNKKTPPTDLLNEFRNLIRKDLSYGDNLELNRNKAWFSKVVFEPKVKSDS